MNKEEVIGWIIGAILSLIPISIFLVSVSMFHREFFG